MKTTQIVFEMGGRSETGFPLTQDYEKLTNPSINNIQSMCFFALTHILAQVGKKL